MALARRARVLTWVPRLTHVPAAERALANACARRVHDDSVASTPALAAVTTTVVTAIKLRSALQSARWRLPYEITRTTLCRCCVWMPRCVSCIRTASLARLPGGIDWLVTRWVHTIGKGVLGACRLADMATGQYRQALCRTRRTRHAAAFRAAVRTAARPWALAVFVARDVRMRRRVAQDTACVSTVITPFTARSCASTHPRNAVKIASSSHSRRKRRTAHTGVTDTTQK